MATGPGAEVGGSGLLTSTSGEVLEELHPNLFGRRAIETWRRMRDDALVGAILFAIEMLVRQVEWRVDKKEAKDADVEFLESCMDDMSMSWGDFIAEALSMLPYGFAFHEIVYKKRQGIQPEDGKEASSKFSDGKIGWRKFPLRAQDTLDRWDFGENGNVQGFIQRPPPDYAERVIPMTKGLLFRTSVYKNNPEGRSILRSAYESWFYKRRIRQIEGTGIERDLAGFPVFWLPAEFLADDASPEQVNVRNAFNDLGKNIRRDKQEHILMPLAYDQNGNKAYDFTLMNAGGSRSFDTSAIIERYNREMAMTVLADFILLGHEKVGSFALSSDKTDLFAVALGTILDSIQDVLNRYAVPRLFALNGMDQTELPSIEHGDIEKPDLAALGTYIQTLSGAGVPLFPDEDLESYLREAANLPEKSEEAKKAQEEQQQAGQEQFGGPDGGGDPSQQGGAGGDGGLPSLQAAMDAARQRRGGSGQAGAA